MIPVIKIATMWTKHVADDWKEKSRSRKRQVYGLRGRNARAAPLANAE